MGKDFIGGIGGMGGQVRAGKSIWKMQGETIREVQIFFAGYNSKAVT